MTKDRFTPPGVYFLTYKQKRQNPSGTSQCQRTAKLSVSCKLLDAI
ncbi:MAG: hypothetical protein ACLR15_09540 [Lachnospiraceae bacterium]